VRLSVSGNGSVVVEGEGRHAIRRGGREQLVERVRIELCRCGGSGTKPYCDQTHVMVGFAAPAAGLAPEGNDGGGGGRMKISALENGPNKIEVEGATAWKVVRDDGSEEIVSRGTIFLCRCGHSEKKPFCDGTHNKIGFRAPAVDAEIAPQGSDPAA
jgi:CDGSH-type Zn-finger protein